jgi:hypothetical protein
MSETSQVEAAEL